ncbi:MAG: hypothetical protein GF398_14090 [Chitinivibrionales bacterium]|nr:hypothetical protein [Chitinivibrionales bacterium]
MHPILFEIPVFHFPIHSYGIALALSFIAGIILSSFRAKNRALDSEVVSDVGLYIIVAAILGARIYYVFLHFDEFKGNPLSIINPFQQSGVGIGGLVMYGGFIGAIAAGLLYFRLKRRPFLPYADAIAPSLGFGIFLTRIGCYLNGCCYGGPTTSPIGVVFPRGCAAGNYQLHLTAEKAALLGEHIDTVPLFPSQLFLSAGGLLIGVIVLLAGHKRLFHGFEFYLTGALYSVHRFAVDFTRHYDSATEKLGPLSHNQIVCIVLFIIFLGLMLQGAMFNSDAAPHNAGNGVKHDDEDMSGRSATSSPASDPATEPLPDNR